MSCTGFFNIFHDVNKTLTKININGQIIDKKIKVEIRTVIINNSLSPIVKLVADLEDFIQNYHRL